MPSASVVATPAKPCKRRSSRLKLKIPLTIQAGDVVLQAETVSVSKHGAKIRILSVSQKLACGEQMRVALRAGRQAQAARVVWLDKRSEPHCGIELEDAGDFWGVFFPEEEDRLIQRSTAPKHAAAGVKPFDFPATAKPAAELRITPRVGKAVARDDAGDTHTLPAMVTGLSAVHMPLSESVDIVFTRPDEATALLRELVEPGTVVRLLFARDRVIMGRVAAIASQKYAGKWRVRIKCDAPCF